MHVDGTDISMFMYLKMCGKREEEKNASPLCRQSATYVLAVLKNIASPECCIVMNVYFHNEYITVASGRDQTNKGTAMIKLINLGFMRMLKWMSDFTHRDMMRNEHICERLE
ncbi:hypothetical protein IEQ34_008525 [Dendrobium chrysotoxum]|uniref:Uncharacterized protein n=1 Tax=Dendrobium chrysotoxum TaxID=161865 RepID=A0AAV7GGP6_DENCH|nr:hypothetical protein IEQ34_008525 [Dendrobium chrysotoxum]